MNVSLSIVPLCVVTVFNVHTYKINFSGAKHDDRAFENNTFKIYFSSCSSKISPLKLTRYTVLQYSCILALTLMRNADDTTIRGVVPNITSVSLQS